MAEAPPILYIPSPSSPKQSNLPILYCALVIVGFAVLLLGLYNLLLIRCCDENDQRAQALEQTSQVSHDNVNVNLVSSFRYKKEKLGGNDHDDDQNNVDVECAVCLSVFEEGEEVKQLPICNHSFHASCIDMWLHSHLDCPLCRSPVEPPSFRDRNSVTGQEESSGEGMQVQGSPV